MKKYVCLFLSLIFIYSCHQKNLSGQSIKPPFRLDPAFENKNLITYSKLGQLVLHQIYQRKINPKINEQLFSGLKKDEYENNFAKLVFISKNSELVFYVPTDLSNDWLFENLNIPRELSNKIVWINRKLEIGQTSFLVSTNISDLLNNEKAFKTTMRKLSGIDHIDFKNMSKYQAVNMKITSRESVPEFNRVNEIVKMGRSCDHGKETSFGDVCRCQYEIMRPIESYLNFIATSEIPKFNVIFQNEELIEQSGLIWKYSFHNFEEKVNFKIDFNKYREHEEVYLGNPLNNECVTRPTERKIIKNKLLYDVELLITGSEFDDSDYGELIDEL